MRVVISPDVLTMEEVAARQKKELKALDTEKRSALKKIKGTAGKGKKAKELLAAAESDYEQKLVELQEKHATELTSFSSGDGETESAPPAPSEDDEKARKQYKARRKREKAKEKEREREKQIAQELQNAGPAPREIENDAILEQLSSLHLTIAEVEADGNCLYRAVGAQCGKDYTVMHAMAENPDEFSPFCEYSSKAPDFEAYLEQVRSSSEWGGHLELRVLSLALKRPIVVYSATRVDPLRVVGDDKHADEEPILVSYHQHYYALGEHYNQVVSTKN